MKRPPADAPVRLSEEAPLGQVGALLSRLPRADPPAGARERSWQRLRGQTQANALRTWTWAGAGAAVAIAVAALLWPGPAAERRATNSVPEPPQHVTASTETRTVRVGAFRVELGPHASARWDLEATGGVHLTVAEGRARIERVTQDTTALATATLSDGTDVEGVAFEVRAAADSGGARVVALADGVRVRSGGAQVALLRRGDTWPPERAALAPAVAPQAKVSAARPPRHRPRKEAPLAAAAPAPDPVATPLDTAPEPPPAGDVDPPDDAALWASANRLVRAGQYPEALELFASLSAGGGPYAGMAVYETGHVQARYLHDAVRAQQAFAAYRQRFPQGPLLPDADLGTLEALVAQDRLDEALTQAEAFVRAHPSSERLPEVQLLRANALRALGRFGEARAVYEALASGSGRIAGEALFFGAFCAQKLGDEPAARAGLRAYVERYPEGAHRDDALRALGGAR